MYTPKRSSFQAEINRKCIIERTLEIEGYLWGTLSRPVPDRGETDRPRGGRKWGRNPGQKTGIIYVSAHAGGLWAHYVYDEGCSSNTGNKNRGNKHPYLPLKQIVLKSIVKLRLTAVSYAQHGGFTTGWSPVSWGSID